MLADCLFILMRIYHTYSPFTFRFLLLISFLFFKLIFQLFHTMEPISLSHTDSVLQIALLIESIVCSCFARQTTWSKLETLKKNIFTFNIVESTKLLVFYQIKEIFKVLNLNWFLRIVYAMCTLKKKNAWDVHRCCCVASAAAAVAPKV